MAPEKPLPEFHDPPVSEVAIGIEFPPLEQWLVPHFGLYWNEIRADYPRCEVHPPIVYQEPFASNKMMHVLADQNYLRCWFLSQTGNDLIQVQPDRFVRNWRKVKGDETYPRYASLRPRFEEAWRGFSDFAEGAGIGAPKPIQYEVTYVNDIERGQGWDQFSDLSAVTPLWAGNLTDRFLSEPGLVSISVVYPIPENIGKLKIDLQHVLRLRDGKEIIQLKFEVRSKPKQSSSETDIMEWIDIGRDWIVRAFADVTTPQMHERWRRRI